MDDRAEKIAERTEQHHCLSDFTRIYGNVMTTKAALHLHDQPGFSPQGCGCVCKCTWHKQIKKFHQDVIGGKSGGREGGGGGGSQEIISPLCKASWRERKEEKMEDPQGEHQLVFSLCALKETPVDFPALTSAQSPLYESS